MALNPQAINCTVNSFTRGTQKLSATAGVLGSPTAETMTALGGIMRFSLGLDPSCDINVGDEVVVIERPPFQLPARGLRMVVEAVYPIGAAPYEQWHCILLYSPQR